MQSNISVAHLLVLILMPKKDEKGLEMGQIGRTGREGRERGKIIQIDSEAILLSLDRF